MGWFRASSSPTTTPDYTGLQLQTSVNTLPIAIVWGQAKIAPNVIFYDNFQTQESSEGGKGFFAGGASGGTTYSADVILALCEGPISGIPQVWKDQSIYSLGDRGLSMFSGATPQAPWGYAASHYPHRALAYQGTCYVCAANYALGDSANLSNHNFEIQGVLRGSGVNGIDADPALVISDFLTNAQYGVGFDGASIDATTLFGASGDSSLQTYCRAIGLCFSPALTDQEQSSSILARWLQICNCAAVWSGGRLRVVPYADVAASGNGYAFYPNVTPIYDLDDHDFVDAKSNEDPLTVARVDPFSLPTIQRIEVTDRSNQYSRAPIEARDQSQIELYGPRVGSTITAHEICDVSVVAPVVAQTILQRALYVRAAYTFKLSWEYCLLDPMDVVTLTDANLGLQRTPVRILSIEEDDIGVLTVAAEEFTAGVSAPTLYPSDSATSTIPNQGAPASPVNPPLIYEPPSALAGGALQVWIGASGGVGGAVDPMWGGAVIWVSLDNLTYSKVGALSSALPQGKLTANLAAATGYDATNALAVDLTESGGALSGAGMTQALQGATLALVDGELLAYSTATLVGANAYSLTGLARGLYGTAPTAHAIGAPFARLNEAVEKVDLPASYIGRKLFLKLASINVFGGGPESLSNCTAYAYTPSGAGSASPIALQLLGGLPVDFGLVTDPSAAADDFGTAGAGAVLSAINLGSAP